MFILSHRYTDGERRRENKTNRMRKIFTCLMISAAVISAHGQLRVANGGTVHLKGNAIISLSDANLINNGTFTSDESGRVIFSGNSTNQISGSHNPELGILEIAKTGAGKLQLQSRVTVSNKVSFVSGLIDLGNYDIDLGTTGFLEGENENSRLTGTGTGEVMIVTSLDAPSSANPGNLGLHITSSQNIGLTAVKRGHRALINGSGGYGIGRYYVVDPVNNEGLNATLRFHYFDAERNSLDENTFALWQSGVDASRWTEHGYSARNTSLNYIEKTGLDSLWKRWTLSPAGALPVTGMTLSASWQSGAALLRWITHSEQNNNHFLIERKYPDELEFSVTGQRNTNHPNGTSNDITPYIWLDRADNRRGPIQYRLQQVNRDGAKSYSNIAVVRPEFQEAFIVNIYPTIGVGNQIFVQTGGLDVQDMQLTIFDVNGRLISFQRLAYQSQWVSLTNLSAGTYKISIRASNHTWTGSFIK